MLLIKLALCICFPAAITGSEEAIAKIVSLARTKVADTQDGKLLVVSDFNGVLTSKGDIGSEGMKTLRNDVVRPLADSERVTFYVSSSKPQKNLYELLGQVKSLGLSSEHNMVTKMPGSESFIPTTKITDIEASQVFSKLTSTAQENGYAVRPAGHLFSTLYKYPEGSNGAAVKVWFERELSKMDNNFARNFEVVLNQDKRQVMVASKLRGKGNLVENLLEEEKYSFGISFGDKPADLGMHEAMKSKQFVGIIVGDQLKQDANKFGFYHLDGPAQVQKLLTELGQILNPSH